MTDDITHAATCDECGEETFAFEKYCHKCGANRWEL
jgi:ribosomal protein L37E